MRHRYLRPALTMPQIYLYRAPIDFRKQVHGLAALVEQQLGHNLSPAPSMPLPIVAATRSSV